MSYSRWTNSVWYTFWCDDRGAEELAVCHVGTPLDQPGGSFKYFTVEMIEADRQQCSFDAFPEDEPVNKLHRAELLEIFDRFLEDVAQEIGVVS